MSEFSSFGHRQIQHEVTQEVFRAKKGLASAETQVSPQAPRRQLDIVLCYHTLQQIRISLDIIQWRVPLKVDPST